MSDFTFYITHSYSLSTFYTIAVCLRSVSEEEEGKKEKKKKSQVFRYQEHPHLSRLDCLLGLLSSHSPPITPHLPFFFSSRNAHQTEWNEPEDRSREEGGIFLVLPHWGTADAEINIHFVQCS